MWLLLPLFCAVATGIRVCESDNTCFHCGDGRFSFYRCRSGMDCFEGETCDNGFCCPSYAPLSGQNNESLNDPCPDGSQWIRRCTSDTTCHPSMEYCAEGKCCAVCGVRRREVLDDLPSTDVFGVHIPQCENTNEMRQYRRRQCRAGTDNCWCVNAFGRSVQGDENCDVTLRRRQENLYLRAQKIRAELARDRRRLLYNDKDTIDNDVEGEINTVTIYNLTGSDLTAHRRNDSASAAMSMAMVCPPNEQWHPCVSACQPTCDDVSTQPCPAPNCQPGCVCQQGFVRRSPHPSSQCVPRIMCVSMERNVQCIDEKREYQNCGSACPVSCATRNTPRCHEKCVQGCFCRVPFILEDGSNPLNSRCILPAQCPLSSSLTPQTAITPYGPMAIPHPTLTVLPTEGYSQGRNIPPGYGSIPPISATIQPNTQRCVDPLKNFISCGSACPVGCNSVSTTPQCSLSCVSGCFCRSPYILIDASQPQSGCILPQNCPSKKDNVGHCSDPRKEWSECSALYCARSCANPLGHCPNGVCSAGCVCREPYVLAVAEDPNSRCVLPSECQRKCEDPAKEFLTCGSSCPMGCDNRNPKHCTPCEPGCYCKNGFVFRNASEWKQSDCVPVEQCPETTTLPPTTIEASTLPTVSIIESVTQSQEVPFPQPTLSNRCPASTLDIGSKACLFDSDCPSQQLCCRASILSLNSAPQRCACEDPNAVYLPCGSLCPEYCGQPSVPVCSATCNPGCMCAPGYVRERNEVGAKCIKRDTCNVTSHNEDAVATISEITATPINDQFENKKLKVATAHLISTDGSTFGKFTFQQIMSSNLRITGSLIGLSDGPHAVILHQFGDISDGCSNLGPIYMGHHPQTSAILGNVVGGTGNSEFTRLVDWPLDDVVGRSIAVYRQGTSEWALRERDERPLACGTIGVTKV